MRSLILSFVVLAAACGKHEDPVPDASPDAGSSADAGGATDTGDGGSAVLDGGGASGPGAVGAACSTTSDCEDGTCLDLPGGYCSRSACVDAGCPDGSACFETGNGASACFLTCSSASQCRTSEGYTCDADDTCYPGGSGSTGTGAIGSACTADSACESDNCYPALDGDGTTGFVGGYCVTFQCTSSSCPADASCVEVDDDGNTSCMDSCNAKADCRAGYDCTLFGGAKVCFPGCSEDADCPAAHVCDDDGLCAPDPRCSRNNPGGTCPSGQLCEGGSCAAFTCNTTLLEPNESQAAAVAAPDGFTAGLTLCTSDQDWFSLSVPAGRIATVGFTSSFGGGDLDLTAHDGTKCLGGRQQESCTWDRWYETGDEFLSVFNGSPSPRTFTWKTAGYRSATNRYSLLSSTVPYTDGASCTSTYQASDCTGGSFQALKLLQFPFADAADPYVPSGYRFTSMSNYRWARREVIMAVRYAIHEVQRQFPGTKPLGLGDMAQRDGITPGYDVNDPRHPETTHDQGGNIDLAYYSTLASAGSATFSDERVVCGPNESNETSDGSFCTPAARTEHVVDLPRQAYFMAKLLENPRVRVIGVDRVLAPLIAAEALRQKDAGLISAAAYGAFAATMASGDGWPYHHHHIHVSFDWWGLLMVDARHATSGCGLPPRSPEIERLHR